MCHHPIALTSLLAPTAGVFLRGPGADDNGYVARVLLGPGQWGGHREALRFLNRYSALRLADAGVEALKECMVVTQHQALLPSGVEDLPSSRHTSCRLLLGERTSLLTGNMHINVKLH